jgi:uncharacterized SAM-binding protein YcdF (DUF218 family)
MVRRPEGRLDAAITLDSVDQIAKLLVPGSLSLLVIAAAAGLALVGLRGRLARLGRASLIMTAVVYCALSSPPVAALVERGLAHDYHPLTDPAAAHGAPAIVILGNGVFIARGGVHHAMQRHTFENVLEGARLVKLLAPRHIILSGGIVDPASQTRTEADVMRDVLRELGVTEDRVMTETRSRNTYEQAVNIAHLLREHEIERFVVVTAAPHMPRVLRLFRKQGLSPIPSVPMKAFEDRGTRPWMFSSRALEDSEAAGYEYLALAGYWLRGRIE